MFPVVCRDTCISPVFLSVLSYFILFCLLHCTGKLGENCCEILPNDGHCSWSKRTGRLNSTQYRVCLKTSSSNIIIIELRNSQFLKLRFEGRGNSLLISCARQLYTGDQNGSVSRGELTGYLNFQMYWSFLLLEASKDNHARQFIWCIIIKFNHNTCVIKYLYLKLSISPTKHYSYV